MLPRERLLTLSSLILAAALTRPTLLPAQLAADEALNPRIARATCEKEFAAGRWMEALPACQAVLKAAERQLGPEDESVAYWLNRVGLAFYQIGNYTVAEPLYQRSLRIRENALGPEHPDIATALNNLAELYRTQGRYAEAEPLLQRSLRIWEMTRSPEHPDVATSLNNLATLYWAQGRYAAAEPLLQRSLNLREKALGPEHPDVATSLNNLAALYRAQSRYAAAEPLYQRCLRIWEKELGPEHPDVAAVLNNLAEQYRAQGRYAAAEPLYQRSLRIWEKTRSPEHPAVAVALNNLAALYGAQGRYAAAEPLLQRSLSLREKALGPEHPDVATSLNNLAGLYWTQDRYAEAEPLLQRSLRIREKALSREHPDVATSLNNLAELYWAQGRYAEAEPLLQRSLRTLESALGPEHPDVATSLNNLAGLYWTQDRYAEAEPLLQHSLGTLEKALGPEHPEVAQSLNNLAALYGAQGRYAEAELRYQRSLRIREKALGSVHPKVAQSLNNLAALYWTQGRYAEAEPLLQRSLRTLEKALGPENPNVATTLNNLAELYGAQGRYAEAEPLLQHSLRILEKALGPEHLYVAQTMNNLASFYYWGDHPAQALPHLKILLERSLHQNGIFHLQSLGAFEQLAIVHQHLGQNQEVGAVWAQFLSELSAAVLPRQGVTEDVKAKLAALLARAFFHSWFQRCFEEADKMVAQVRALPLAKEAPVAATLQWIHAQLTATSPVERKLLSLHAGFTKGQDDAHALRLFSRGMEDAAQERMGEAARFLREGLYLGERHLRRQKSVKAVSAWLGQERPYLDLIFELVRKQPRDAAALSLAWAATLLSKGRTLDAETKALRVLRDPQAALRNPILWRIQEDVKNRWRQGVMAGTGGVELHGLGQQVRDTEATLAQSSDTLRIEALPEPFELVRAVAAQLPKDGVLLEFVEYVPRLGTDDGEGAARYLALLLFRAEGAAEPRMHALDLGQVRAHAPRLRDLLAALHDPTSQPQKKAKDVYDALLAPARKVAGAVTQLWLVPDGALNLIPFDALHDGTQYLLDSPLRIRYLASGRDLVFSYSASSGRPPLVLGNPLLETAAPLPAATAPVKDKAAPASAKRRRGAALRSARSSFL